MSKKTEAVHNVGCSHVKGNGGGAEECRESRSLRMFDAEGNVVFAEDDFTELEGAIEDYTGMIIEAIFRHPARRDSAAKRLASVRRMTLEVTFATR